MTAPATRSVQDMLAERRSVVEEHGRETDATARSLLQFQIDSLDVEILDAGLPDLEAYLRAELPGCLITRYRHYLLVDLAGANSAVRTREQATRAVAALREHATQKAAQEMRDAIASAVEAALLQSKAMQALTTDDVRLIARAAAGNAAQALAGREAR